VTQSHTSQPDVQPPQPGANQRTLADAFTLAGVGLFTAAEVTLTVEPGQPDQGVTFTRTDLESSPTIGACVENVRPSPRRTTLAVGETSVQTVEHLLAALSAMGVDNVRVSGPEIPILDGSALPFAQSIVEAGLADLDAPRRPIRLADPVTAASHDALITAIPSDDHPGAPFRVEYALDYPGSDDIPTQSVTFGVTPETFLAEIAPARTFSTRAEAEAAREQGLFTHVSPKDMLVLERGRAIDNELRFPDEPARHKALDVIGDLALLGSPLNARVVASRSGHALHHDLAQRIASAHAAMRFRSTVNTPELDIDRILALLPHRYPFVLVDRVLEIEEGFSATGVKNVSVNEPYFPGHYPHSPIMPGVLIVEAMCQLAGLMLHKTLDHEGKVALLLSMDGIRLRKAVRPGDQLLIRSTLVKATKRAAEVACTARVEGELVAEVQAKFLMTPPPTKRA